MAKIKTDVISSDFEADELLALARLDLEKSNLEGALAKLKQILSGADVLPEAQAMAARLYAQLGLHERAQGFYKAYLQSNPTAVTEKFQFGMTHLEGGHPLEALKIWDELLKDYPTHPPALFYKGLALAQQGKPNEAKQSLDVLLKSVATDNLYFGRGKELLQAINQGNGMASSRPEDAKRNLATLPHDAYKTEH